MPEVHIQVAACIVAVLINMIVGTVWYGPLFGKPWQKFVGMTGTKMKQADRVTPLVAMLLLAIVQVFILVHFITYAHYFYPNYTYLSIGLITGAWAWVGFVLPALAGSHLFAGRRKKLLLIDATYYLVVLLANGALLSLWR